VAGSSPRRPGLIPRQSLRHLVISKSECNRFSLCSPVFPCHHQSTDISYSFIYLPPAVYYFRKKTYLLTPRSTVLLEKLTVSQLVEKFPAFYETRRFITAFTPAHHLSLFWAILRRIKASVQAQSTCICFVTSSIFYGEELLAPRPNPIWRTTPSRLSAFAYSIYSQLLSILETVPSSATWGRAMPGWQGPHLSRLLLLLWQRS